VRLTPKKTDQTNGGEQLRMPKSTGNFGIRLSLRVNLLCCHHRFSARRSAATPAPETAPRRAAHLHPFRHPRSAKQPVDLGLFPALL